MLHSIYIHIPFCTHRCAYCDFNTYAGQDELIPAYVDALCREVELVGNGAPQDCAAHTVFFGGGTPSLLSARHVERVLGAIRSAFHVEQGAEVTLEANPGTVALQALEEMRKAGVNRLSMGVQSANGEELRMLERTHHFGDVLRSVADARLAGFDNLNLDLIYGLPEQDLQTWERTLRRILDLRPEHISAYCLTLEHGTPFGTWARRGLMPIPDPDVAADMYELASDILESQGYGQYEISNWAHPGHQCRHNLQYWKGGAYLGFGAGAHGYADGHRYSNVMAIREYIARLSAGDGDSSPPGDREASAAAGIAAAEAAYPCSPAALERHLQSNADDMAEFMIMGLRLTHEGIDETTFLSKFGRGLQDVYGRQLSKLSALGLIEFAGRWGTKARALEHGVERSPARRIRLTRRGRLLGNRVFSEFVD